MEVGNMRTMFMEKEWRAERKIGFVEDRSSFES
jgi:hypothetical protein